MGILKNDVGRPSNKTIMIRTILKGICLIIILALVAVGAYYLGNSNGENKSSNKNKTTTKQSVNKTETFDENQVTTKKIPDTEDGIYIYVYGKKLDIDAPITNVDKVETINDIAVISGGGVDLSFLIIVDTNSKILYNTINDNGGICTKDISNECYDFKIHDNKITYYVNYFMTSDMVCDYENKDDETMAEFEIIYSNGKLSSPKKISSITAKEYIEKHNIKCSN